jgi:2-dehydro-3-deoxyphosphogalactonate aldolase
MLCVDQTALDGPERLMQLKDIKTFVVGNPPPHFGGRWFVFVKLTTDDNISGIGES